MTEYNPNLIDNNIDIGNTIKTENIKLLSSQINYPTAPSSIQDEDNFIKKVDKYIFEKNKNLHSKSKLENFTLKEIIENLYKVLYDIIDDIAKIDFNPNEFNKDNLKKKWWEKYIELFNKIFSLLIIPERAFYIGIIFIIISFCIYFIDLTE